MNPSHRALMLAASLSLAMSARADSAAPSDPQVTSWLVTPSGRYARIFETDAAQNAGTAVTTWSRGQGTQSTPTYAGVMQIAYSANWIYLRSSGLGYHVMGPWYLNAAHTQNFPNFPANTNVLYRIPRTPAAATNRTLTGAGAIGYFVDGVALFDNRDTFSYANAAGTDAEPTNGQRGDGVWNRDAYINEGVTFDPAFAHQAGAMYHYHANSPALRYELGDHVEYVAATKTYREGTAAPTQHSPILGWVADGFPLYGPYGYSSPLDATSGVRRMISGYVKRDGANGTTNLAATGRTTLPAWAARAQNRSASLPANVNGPAVNATYALGHYLEDYDYLGDLGKTQGVDFDLDACNGRFCVTPEFPQGTYAYFTAIETDGTPRFPYNIGRWYYGTPSGGAVTSINETVTEYVRGGQAATIALTAVRADGGVLLTWNSVEGGTYAIASSSDGVTFTTIASGVTSGGSTTTYTTAAANYYRVTLTAVASYDSRGTGGLSGVNGNGNVRYTEQVVGTSGTARLANLAMRAYVGTGEQVLIPGLVISGTGTVKVLLRAVGPTLASFGVNGALADPQVALYRGDVAIAGNDNWSAAANAAEIQSAANEAGAFALANGSRDAALIATLEPGAYSAIVSGVGGASGTALVEMYVLR